MRCKRFKALWIFVLLLLLASPAAGEKKSTNEVKIVNDLQVNFNDVSGPGMAASSLTDGTNYVENLNIYTRGSSDLYQYFFNFGGRTTNDKRVDEAEFSLTTLKGHLTYGSHQLDAGDIFESYSQYSLDSALKGTAYKYYNETDELPDVSFVYGMLYPRWENLWSGYNLEAIERQVFGGNISHHITPNLKLGASIVRSEDAKPVRDTDALYANNVYSVDLEYNPIPGLTIKAESAISDTSENVSDRTHTDEYHGNAHKIEAIGDGHPSRVVLSYERVSPKFKSLTGSVISDQERVTSSWRYKYSKDITTNLNFLWLRNHINGSPDMTHTWQPQANISVRRLFDRRYATTSLSYKFEKKAAPALSTQNQYLTLSHTDRYGIVQNSTTLGLNRFDTDNDTRDQLDYTANTTFNLRYNVGDVVFKPSVNAGSFFYENKLIGQTNQVIQYSAGLGVDVPKKKISAAVTAGQNRLRTFGQDNSDKFFSRFHVYYRPKFSGYLNQSTFSLRGAINDYSYSTCTRDFVEKTLTIGINIPFSIK